MSGTGSAGGPPARRSPAAQGFTLIEALVVMAIAALVAGIMFPSLQRTMTYWEYRSAATRVQAALERGRAEALRGGVAVRFLIAPGGDGYRLGSEAAARLPASVRIATGRGDAISFFRDGSASGGSVRVTARGRRAVFDVSPVTGLVGLRS